MYVVLFNSAEFRVKDIYIACDKGIYLSNYKDRRLLNLLIPKSEPGM
jgi:hypothetical protein